MLSSHTNRSGKSFEEIEKPLLRATRVELLNYYAEQLALGRWRLVISVAMTADKQTVQLTHRTFALTVFTIFVENGRVHE